MKARAAALRLGGLALLCVGFLMIAIRVGAVSLGTGELIRALAGEGSPTTVAIVQHLRLPRAVQSGLVGAALAASGATFQALLRNPLADPYVLGVSSGAAVGAVAAVVTGLGNVAFWAIPAAAFLGALLAIGLVLRIAVGVGSGLDTRTLLLAGVMVGAFFNAVILLLLTIADTESFRSALFWMMGSNSGATGTTVTLLVALLLVGLVALGSLARPLDLLAVGEETAQHLGVPIRTAKLAAFAIASLLAAVAVAVSGVIGFVGLVVPHAIRYLWGGSHRFLLPASALLGAAFLIITDALARTVVAPTELPIGVVTAFLGVPFFVWLMRRRRA